MDKLTGEECGLFQIMIDAIENDAGDFGLIRAEYQGRQVAVIMRSFIDDSEDPDVIITPYAILITADILRDLTPVS